MNTSTITVNGTEYTLPFHDIMPPQLPEERSRLLADIRANGIRVPVVVTDLGEVLDGHHRLAIAAELGLTDIPFEVKAGLTAEQKLEYAESVNLHRRHLSREQVNELIAKKLTAGPARSDRDIAAETGVDHKRVGRVRKAVESTGASPQLTATKGRDGKTRKRKAAKPKPESATAMQPPARDGHTPPQRHNNDDPETIQRQPAAVVAEQGEQTVSSPDEGPPTPAETATPSPTATTASRKPWPALGREGGTLQSIGKHLRILGGASGKKRSVETMGLIELRVRQAEACLTSIVTLVAEIRAQLETADGEGGAA